MLSKLIVLLILIMTGLYFLNQFNSAQITPETKQQTLKPVTIPPSLLDYPNLRWNHMPLTVFINPAASKESYISDVKLAMALWKDATNGMISFELTKSKDADITIEWVGELKTNSLDAAGDTNINFYNQTAFKIINNATIELLDKIDSKELNDFDMTNLAIHEIGHALGLSHNDAKDSVMNPVLKIPSKEIKPITKQEIQLLLDTYKIQPKPDLYISTNSTVTKIVDTRLFKENYYINTVIAVENNGLITSTNTTMLIKAGGMIVREDNLPEIPVGAIFTRTYVNQPVSGNFSNVEIILDSDNLVDELNEANNLLILKA